MGKADRINAWHLAPTKIKNPRPELSEVKFGAGNEIRTRDLLLGKETLYH